MPHLQVQTRNSPERRETTATLPIRPNSLLALLRFKAERIPPFPWHWREASLHGHALQAPSCGDQTYEYEACHTNGVMSKLKLQSSV
jgi:hypothetical protein